MQDNPTSFKKFKKIPLLASILLLIFSCSVLYFLYRTINNNMRISEQTQMELEIETFRRNEIKSLERSIKAIGGEIILLESHFAKSSDIVPFLDNIEELADVSGAEAEIVSVDILKEKNELMIRVKALGKFEALYKFLTLLENSPYGLDFASVHMQRKTEQIIADTAKTMPNWEASFQIKLLSFIQ